MLTLSFSYRQVKLFKPFTGAHWGVLAVSSCNSVFANIVTLRVLATSEMENGVRSWLRCSPGYGIVYTFFRSSQLPFLSLEILLLTNPQVILQDAFQQEGVVDKWFECMRLDRCIRMTIQVVAWLKSACRPTQIDKSMMIYV